MLIDLILLAIVGFGLRKIFKRIGLPALLGFLIMGVLVGPFVLDLLSDSLLQYSTEIRNLALIVILLRAGFGLKKDVLMKYGKTSLLMGSLPAILEGLFVLVTAMLILDFDFAQAGMLGFILAAVSPAVIVPSMLSLLNKNYQKVPTVILAGASIDDVFAITIFSSFLSLYFKQTFSLMTIINIPLVIILGIVFGYLLARVLALFIDKINMYVGVVLLILISYLLVILNDRIPFDIAVYLSVMVLAFILNTYVHKASQKIKHVLDAAWPFLEIYLFVLVGALVDPNLAVQAGFLGFIVIVVGLVGRALGVIISLRSSDFNKKERIFSILSYTPKATVQAAMGSIPLSMSIAGGELMLAIAVLSIIITAPLGAMLIDKTYNKLLTKD